MNGKIPVEQYIHALTRRSNEKLSMDVLLNPFGIEFEDQSSRTILIGHLLDELFLTYEKVDYIDGLDVAAAAWELGHEGAGRFLEVGPDLIFKQLIKGANPKILN